MFTRMLGASTHQFIFESVWPLSLSYPTKPTVRWYRNRLFTPACVKFARCVCIGLRVEIFWGEWHPIVPIRPLLHCPLPQIQRSLIINFLLKYTGSKYIIYTGWAKKTGLFLKVDNFATVGGRNTYHISKFSKFYLENEYITRMSVR